MRETGHLWLSDAALEGLGITTAAISEAIETALIDKREGRLHVSPKSAILPGEGRYMMSTLSVGESAIVVKQVSVCPENPSRDLPSINGAIMVLDPQTGLLKAVLGANWITAVRTAGLSDVAAARLADPSSEILSFIGTGTQARSHLDAFAARFPLRHIKIFGRGQANIDRLVERAAEKGLTSEVASSGDDALRDADIVVTSLTLNYDTEPFLDASRLKPGAFAAITDLAIPWHDRSMSAFGSVVVDDLEQERASDKPMVAADLISGDLTDLVADNTALSDGPRAFIFRGIALGDYAAAALAVSRAKAQNAGQWIGGEDA